MLFRSDWQTRDFKLIPYHKYMIWMIQLFRFIEFRHIPRTQNYFADALATLAAMVLFEDGMEIPPIIIDVSLNPAYCLAIEDEPDDLLWYYDIKHFLQNQEYPAGSTQTDKRTLRRLALQFFLNGEVLYKKTPYYLLRCLNAREARLAIEEVHEGVCGSHMNGHMLA